MVELLPLEQSEDLEFMQNTLTEFKDKTGSEEAGRLLEDWPEQASKFVKVIL